MTFHTKNLWVQDLCILGLIKQMDLLKLMIELGIQNYLVNIYNVIYSKINCLICEKSDAKYIINHNFGRIRIDSYNSLPIEKATFDNIIIHIKSVDNKNKNNCFFKCIFRKRFL